MRSVIFDWDGTLARTLHLWIDGYEAAFDRRGLFYGRAQIVADFFHEHDKVPALHPALDFAPIAVEARAHVFAAVAAVGLYDGAVDLLRDLQAQGVRLARVSSSPRTALERGLAAHDLGGFFASIIAGDDGFGHKPDTLPFRQTLARLGAQACDTLVIGDSHVDILAGQAAGCRTCWFAPADNAMFHDFAHIQALGADHQVSALDGFRAHVLA